MVDQTAIETAAENLEIRYDLHQQVALRGPLGETDTAWIVVAFAASLDDALVAWLREVVGGCRRRRASPGRKPTRWPA